MFGNLPGSAPGGAKPAPAATPAAERRRAPPRRPPAGSLDPPRAEAGGAPIAPGARRPTAGALRRRAEPRDPPPAEPEHGGVEDLAWAGIAVAAEAATLGVRLLSRAVEAVRKPADRR